MYLWNKIYEREVKSGLVKIMVIPDISSVNYGRSVGYIVKQIEVNNNISNISESEIRQKSKTMMILERNW